MLNGVSEDSSAKSPHDLLRPSIIGRPRPRWRCSLVTHDSLFATSWLFLVCYIWNHTHHRSPERVPVRISTWPCGGSHTILAVVIMPLTLTNAIPDLARMIRASQENRLLETLLSFSGSTPLLLALSPTGCCITYTHR